MRRKISEIISIQGMKHLIYIIPMILKIKNYFDFINSYIGISSCKKVMFRNGIVINIKDQQEPAAIVAAFIKKDYGNLKDNSTIVDIGANIGAFSIYASKYSSNCKIYAYEPANESYKSLVNNVKNNKIKNIFVINKGIAAKKEKRKIYFLDSSLLSSIVYKSNLEKYAVINCIKLKDIFIENKINRINLLKIDCEGAEYEILYNSKEDTLKKIDEIRMEFHNSSKIKKDHIDFLKKYLKKNHFSLLKIRYDGPHCGIAWFKNEKTSK